jgi:PEP-CTERM motif
LHVRGIAAPVTALFPFPMKAVNVHVKGHPECAKAIGQVRAAPSRFGDIVSIRRALAVISVLVFLPLLGLADNFSFTGSFQHDTDLQTFTFTLASPTAGVTLQTWSYAGGTDAAGDVVTAGGFEPFLNLYMADGTQMNPGPGGACAAPVNVDPVSGGCGDAYYPTTLSFPGGFWSPGTYTVVLSIFANPGIGNLSDGFFANQVLGLPDGSNFTCTVGSPGYQGSPGTIAEDQPFCDEFLPNTERTGNWELDIVGVDSATQEGVTAVPEPTSLLLLGTGLAGFAGAIRKKLKR